MLKRKASHEMEGMLRPSSIHTKPFFMQDTDLPEFVTRFLPLDLLEREARAFGLIKRVRKVEILPLIWTLLFATLSTPNASLSHWHRLYCATVGQWLSYSSFYDRLTPALADFFDRLLLVCLRKQRKMLPHWLCPLLPGLDGVFALDSSTVALRDDLRQTWQACAKAKSALKLHAVINVLSLEPHSVHLSQAKVHDSQRLMRLTSWCRRRLLLTDLGYYSFEMFYQIHTHQGFFLSRVKKGFNPRVLQDFYSGKGQPMATTGKRLADVLAQVQRHEVEVEVELWAKTSKTWFRCRVLARRREAQDPWQICVTNLPRESYGVQDTMELYRMRWQVELYFKQLKSLGNLDAQPSVKAHLVRLRTTLVILMHVMCGVLSQRLSQADSRQHYPVGRVMEALRIVGLTVLQKLCEPYSRHRATGLFERLARDPNQCRIRAFDPLLRVAYAA